jgi:hypothetical protein
MPATRSKNANRSQRPETRPKNSDNSQQLTATNCHTKSCPIIVKLSNHSRVQSPEKRRTMADRVDRATAGDDPRGFCFRFLCSLLPRERLRRKVLNGDGEVTPPGLVERTVAIQNTPFSPSL